MIAVSCSGETSGLAHVLDHAAEIGVGRLVLLTAARRPPLAGRLRPLSEDLLIRYGPVGDGSRACLRERGFVSIAATVMPTIRFVCGVASLASLVDLAGRLVDGSPEVGTSDGLAAQHAARELLLVGGGWTVPAVTDVEGKFAEADLGPTRLDEPKDFSHGRFISVLGSGPRGGPKQPVLMLTAGGPTAYERALREALQQDGHVAAAIGSPGPGRTRGPGAPLPCPTVLSAGRRGARHRHQPSGPPPPESGLALYRSRAHPA